MTTREEYLKAFTKDLSVIQAEVDRLRATHDARFVLGYLLGAAVDISQALGQVGMREYVAHTWNGATQEALLPPDAPVRLITDGNTSERPQ